MASNSWNKTYTTVKLKRRNNEPKNERTKAFSNSQDNWLGNYYQGSFDRLSRYVQYDHMDYDVDVNLALDTTAEFCTLLSEDESLKVPFNLIISDKVDSSVSTLLREALKSWCRMNDWNSRLFECVRNTLKYGDQIFIRDPDTYKLHWVDIYNVSKVLVNELEGKVPEYYYVKNMSPNLEGMVATQDSNLLFNLPFAGSGHGPQHHVNNSTYSNSNYNPYNNHNAQREYPVSATNIVHVTLSNGMDNLWPFGRSILDSSFKPFKQKELLEDAIIIYRVQRSPERLVFNVDTGDMSPKNAARYLDETAKGLRQKRIPVIDRGDGKTIMDTTYNPMSITEDFFFAKGADGRGTTVETLPGGESTGNIEDLKFFTSRLVRSLRVPLSYLSFPMDDGEKTAYNDGKLGTAYMEEFQFSQYCKRIQRQLIKSFNREFKLFIKAKDLEISASDYDIEFTEPQSFGDYRQIEKDTAQLSVFSTVAGTPWLSKRFMAERFMGLSQDEIKRNERLWKEEKNIEFDVTKTSVGETGINIAGDDDLDEVEELEAEADGNDEDMDLE